mgnify:CR=1 FL=1
MIFKGSATALITPFTGSGQVDFDALKKLLDFQINNGTKAIVVLGTTGEASTISKQEKISIVEYAVDYVAGRVPVIAGSGSNDTAVAVETSKAYENLGVDGLLIVTPYYNKCTQNGLIKHYFEIADKVDTEIIVYSVQGRTGVNILPTTAVELSKHKNITAIKEASGNIEQITEILRTSSLDVYSGDDGLTYPVLALGGQGIISVASNIIPKIVSEICENYFAGNIEKSRELQFEINPLIKLLFLEVNPIPVKKAASLMGLCEGILRMPLTEMQPENVKLLEKELQKILISN